MSNHDDTDVRDPAAKPEDVPCEFCGDPVGTEGAGSTACDFCWYGQRMDPKGWVRALRKKGRHVVYQGGCIHFSGPNGESGIACRNPYTPDDGKVGT